MRLHLKLLLMLLNLCLTSCSGLCTDHDVTDSALVNILLDETSGNCDVIKLGPIQDRAAIEFAVHSVNSALKTEGFDIKIKTNILDTCSNVKNVKKIVLKALVTSEQTCPEPPLLLGFIGPQNIQLLNETKKVTNVFSTLHILGGNYEEHDYDNDARSTIGSNEDTLYLYENYVQHKYEILVATLQKLNWASFTLIRDEAEVSQNIGRQFLTARHALQGKPCVVGDTLTLPRDKADVYGFYKKLLLELEGNRQDGLLIIVDEISTELAEFLRKFGTENPTVLSVNRVGVGSWRIPKNNHFFLLQEVSPVDVSADIASFVNKTALNRFLKQEEDEMKSTLCINKDEIRCDGNKLVEDTLYKEYDASTLVQIYSLNLLSFALKSLHRMKCKGESPGSVCTKLASINKADDLNRNIRRAAMVYNGATVRFNMNAEPLVHIYNVDLMDNQVKLAAKVRSHSFELLPNAKLPVKPFNGDRQRYCRTVPSPTRASTGATGVTESTGKLDEDATVRTIVMSTQTSRPSIWNFIPNVRDIRTREDYVNIGIVFVSAGSAFFLFMLCMICCLWRCFRVKGNNDDRDTYDNRSIRSVESGARVRVERRKGKRQKVARNESVRSTRSD